MNMNNLVRNLQYGTSNVMLTDYQLAIDTNQGESIVVLPTLSSWIDFKQNKSGAYTELQSIRFSDIGGVASINNITFVASDGDSISGSSTLVINTNNQSGILIPNPDGKSWMYVSSLSVQNSSTNGVEFLRINANGEDISDNSPLNPGETKTIQISNLLGNFPSPTESEKTMSANANFVFMYVDDTALEYILKYNFNRLLFYNNGNPVWQSDNNYAISDGNLVVKLESVSQGIFELTYTNNGSSPIRIGCIVGTIMCARGRYDASVINP